MTKHTFLWFGVLLGLAGLTHTGCGGTDRYMAPEPGGGAAQRARGGPVDPVGGDAEGPHDSDSPLAAPMQEAEASEERMASVAPAPHALADGAEADALLAQPQAAPPGFNTEQYDHTPQSEFVAVSDAPLSTFSVDVDTASYSNVRRFLTRGRQPPADAVRVEELINYFDYDYGEPEGDHPIAIATEVADCPWNPDHALVRVGLLARDRSPERDPQKNLVFLLDVSGSMDAPDKLPLLKRAMGMLTRQLSARDRVAIVVYAGASGVVLPPTSGADQGAILSALDRLSAGGSTNGASGIELAYALAGENRGDGAINRVILATDGDFNVGNTSRGGLTRLIERERQRGVFLTVLGFGMGNLKDATMEMLADRGNGNYAYIDTDREAQKVLVDEIGSTLKTVAKDSKIQVEFNPKTVAAYRLLGYENRRLADRDFNDDTKDAGDMGDGHTVTALYEIRRAARGAGDHGKVDPLRYQTARTLSAAADSSDLMTVKVRYKHPDDHRSRLLSTRVADRAGTIERASADFRFATAVATFGLMLRRSPTVAGVAPERVRALAAGALGEDRHGLRREFLQLVGMVR